MSPLRELPWYRLIALPVYVALPAACAHSCSPSSHMAPPSTNRRKENRFNIRQINKDENTIRSKCACLQIEIMHFNLV